MKETKEEEKWKVDEAVRTLEAYQKLIKDKKLKEKAIEEIANKAKEYKELANKLD